MSDQPEALLLSDWIDRFFVGEIYRRTSTELRRLQGLIDACAIYLKEGETPADRILRERGDTDAVCRLYAKEREKNQELLEALKLAQQIIGHPDDAHSKLIAAVIAKVEGQQ